MNTEYGKLGKISPDAYFWGILGEKLTKTGDFCIFSYTKWHPAHPEQSKTLPFLLQKFAKEGAEHEKHC